MGTLWGVLRRNGWLVCTMFCIPYVVLCILYTLLFKTQQNVNQEKSYGGSCKIFFLRDPRDNFGPYCILPLDMIIIKLLVGLGKKPELCSGVSAKYSPVINYLLYIHLNYVYTLYLLYIYIHSILIISIEIYIATTQFYS